MSTKDLLSYTNGSVIGNWTDDNGGSSSALHWADYLVLAVVFLATLSIGGLFRFMDRKKKSPSDFLFASKDMSFFPVAVSLFMSAAFNVSMTRDPLEVYTQGIIYWISGIGSILAVPIIAHGFAVLFHLMELNTTFQFLEIRFSPYFRPLCSVLYGLITLFYSATSLHIHGSILEQVADIPVWLSIFILGVVCLAYTSLGGLKAVIWADVLHCMIILSSLITLLFFALFHHGGLMKVWEIADSGGRINFIGNFSPNPLIRSTFWTYLIGYFFKFLSTYCYEQFAVQRYSALKSIGHVVGAMYTMIPLICIFTSLYALLGLAMYAHFHDCDPVADQRVRNANLMLPLMARDLLGAHPGLMGLFTACISCASLCYVSSSQIALATTWLYDIGRPLYKRHASVQLTESQANSMARILALAVGIAITSISFVLYLLTILSVPIIILRIMIMLQIVLWPIIGLYVVGVIFRFIKAQSAMLGALCCFVLCVLFAIGVVVFPSRPSQLPVSTDGCDANQNTSDSNIVPTIQSFTTRNYSYDTETPSQDDQGFSFGDIFSLSPLLYSSFGPILTALFSLLFAAFQYCCFREKDTDGTQDASGEFDTEGFHVEAPVGYRARHGYNEVPSIAEDNHSQISGMLPKECRPMVTSSGDSQA